MINNSHPLSIPITGTPDTLVLARLTAVTGMYSTLCTESALYVNQNNRESFFYVLAIEKE